VGKQFQTPTADAEDQLAARKREWYRQHPEQANQSTISKVLEFFGQDNPYANDSSSYDYRQQAWDDSQEAGNPDVGWMLPILTDEQTIAADDALGDLPDALKGTNEREGEPVGGFLAHSLDQVNYTPWDTGDILSVFSNSSPDSVRRDIATYKGGPSSLDEIIGDSVGAPREQDWQEGYRDSVRDPAVEASEWAGMLVPFGVVGKAVRGAKAAHKGGKAVVAAVRKATRGAPSWRGAEAGVTGEIGGAKARFRQAGRTAGLPIPEPAGPHGVRGRMADSDPVRFAEPKPGVVTPDRFPDKDIRETLVKLMKRKAS